LKDVNREYTLQDITEEVSNYLIEELGHDKGVSSSTIEKDIRHMRSSEGYGAPIEVEKTASGWFYYYSDRKFSITNSPLDSADAKKLKGILAILDQFRHLPQLEVGGRSGLQSCLSKILRLLASTSSGYFINTSLSSRF